METLNREQIIRIFKSYEYASYMGSDLLYLPESEYEDAANDIIKLTSDRDKRISDLEKELLKADELIEKLSIAPDLAYDAGYLNKEKELIELIKKYETDKPKDI